MNLEFDVSLSAYEIWDMSGDESQVIYCPDGYVLTNNPFYKVGMAKKKFVVISQLIDGKRSNRLLLDRKLVEKLKCR